MKIAYYLNEGRKKNLYCRISDGSERVSFSLGYGVSSENWSAKKEELDFEDSYYYTLHSLKKYLEKRYYELKSLNEENVLNILKNEVELLMKDDGIEGIARKMFDDENQENSIPKYDQFILAFEKFSNLKKNDYKVQAIGHCIHFHTEDEIFEMETYEGLTTLLKSFIERKSCDEIVTMTNASIWSEIYLDAGIEKNVFLPKMLTEWEIFWNTKYKDIRESIGKTDHLDNLKAESWRQFQVFMECYDTAGDIIDLAYRIDEMDIYPIAVITMLNIFDAECCYSEYCELELDGSGEWESIALNEEDDDSIIFHIRPYEV